MGWATVAAWPVVAGVPDGWPSWWRAPPGTPVWWRLSGDAGLVEGGAQGLGEGDGVAGGPEVGVEQPRVVVQGVVVQGHHGDPAAAQRGQDVLDLAAGHREVAVDGGLSAAEGLEVQGGGDAQAGR